MNLRQRADRLEKRLAEARRETVRLDELLDGGPAVAAPAMQNVSGLPPVAEESPKETVGEFPPVCSAEGCGDRVFEAERLCPEHAPHFTPARPRRVPAAELEVLAWAGCSTWPWATEYPQDA